MRQHGAERGDGRRVADEPEGARGLAPHVARRARVRERLDEDWHGLATPELSERNGRRAAHELVLLDPAPQDAVEEAGGSQPARQRGGERGRGPRVAYLAERDGRRAANRSLLVRRQNF